MFIIYQLELLFFIVTTILYLLVLICVFQEWKSKNTLVNISFFQLFFITGIIDLLALFGNNFLNVMPKGCLIPEFYKFGETVFLHTYFVLCWGCGANQSFCVIFIALNRLTTILNQTASSKFWNSKWIYLIFTLQILPGFITGGFTFISDVYWKIEIDDCALIPSFKNKVLPNIYFRIAGIYQFVTSAILIIIYSIILLTLKKARNFQKDSSANLSSYNKKYFQRQFFREIRLLIMSSIICGCQVFLSFYLIIRIFTKIDKDYVGVSFILDVCGGINPYLMLIFCTAIRNRVFGIFGFIRKGTVKSVKIQSSIRTISVD